MGHLAPLIFLALLLCLSFPAPAQAQGLGWGGSFGGQHFNLLRGETTPADTGIYVLINNPGNSSITVEITTPDLPPQVELLLPTRNLTLEPGERQELNITIKVGQEAAPGDYTLTVAGKVVTPGPGIHVGPGGQSQATLTILGEAGTVVIRAVDPEGKPFPSATIGVYKEIAGNLSLVYSLQGGSLETKLAPGNYIARALYGNLTLTEEEFSLAADEEKEIDLVCYSPCLTSFTVSPVYSANGVLASARITYGIANLLQPVDNVTVLLKVSVANRTPESTELLTCPTLGVGETRGGDYSYSPAEGWQKGRTYSFTIELQIGGELYYQSPAQELTPAGVPGGVNWAIIGGIIAAVVVVAVVVYLVRRRRPEKA